ncbi:MAG: iron-containing alcohol dehydrogenase [Elusimicrobiota bacterium]|nr:iron-containing alcohol dehydrogenase [Elusimicrobiota bacterium]
MNDFVFYCPTKIIFGKGGEDKIGEYIKPFSSNVLFHYGGGSIKKSGLYDKVTASLKNAGIKFTELGGVQPNPLLSVVNKGIKIVKDQKIDFILAVGGGSVIDSAKAIAAGVKYDGDVWDFFINKATVKAALPVATILTIPAAGSESSGNSVITNDENLFKFGISNDKLRPVFSILNPEFCFSLPPIQRANGICDMMAHVFERYFTNVNHTETGDKLCEGLLKAIINSGPKVLKNERDYDAWAEIMWAGALAHNGLLGRGRQEDWGSHGLEHPLSAVYGIAHGSGLAIMFPAWMKYVYKNNLGFFVQFAVNVWGVNDNLRDFEAVALEGIEKTAEFFKSLGLPSKLTEIGAKESDFEDLAAKALGRGPFGAFKRIDKVEYAVEIYKIAYK